MRGHLPLALITIILGALETAGGAQELIYAGILQSRTAPLAAGTVGTVGGMLMLAAGIALLVRSPLFHVLAQATAWVAVPVAILLGVIKHYTGWPMTVVGVVLPLALVLYSRKWGKAGQVLSQV